MFVLSPDALMEFERFRTFLDQINPGAARRAMRVFAASGLGAKVDRSANLHDGPRAHTLLEGSAADLGICPAFFAKIF
jgi:hypothetical protein